MFDSKIFLLVFLFTICILGSLKIFYPNYLLYLKQWFLYIAVLTRDKASKLGIRKKVENISTEQIMRTGGYSYDPKKDIFYTKLNAWQRNMGYFRLYDKAAAPLSMIIDCEPIYFEYDNRRWLIQFWKGQYGMTTGAEVGVYATSRPNLNIPGLFNGTFFYCVDDEDLLLMSITLNKLGKTLFYRTEPHWWITGFKLGEFSEPWELSMNILITLKDEEMRDAFIGGLDRAGYSKDELIICDNTVGILFNEPRTRQPITRTKYTDRITQKKNRLLCERFMEATSEYDNSWDRLNAVQQNAPEILYDALNIGKTRKLFKLYNKIKKYLN